MYGPQALICVRSYALTFWPAGVSVSIYQTTNFEMQEIPPTFMEYIVMQSSLSTIATSTPLATLARYAHQSSSGRQLGSHFDAYYYLAQWSYMFSNRLYHIDGDNGHDRPHEKLGQFLRQLFSELPQRVFSAALNIRFPSIHAAWDALMGVMFLIETEEEFSYLVESGLHHLDWILPYRHELLAHASRLGCEVMITRLLSIGASTEVILAMRTRFGRNYYLSSESTALEEAAKSHHGSCFRLLLQNCDINKDCTASSPRNARWMGVVTCDFCVNHAPNSVFFHFVRNFSASQEDFRSEAMEMLLEAGANVDACAPCDRFDFEDCSPFHTLVSSPLPAAIHTSVVENTFYTCPRLFHKLLPYSRIPPGQMSQSKLLQAAVKGCGALKAYMQTLTADASEVKGYLESCLAKAFSFETRFHLSSLSGRIRVIHNLLLSGVDPALPSVRGAPSIQCMLNSLVIWGRKVVEEQAEALPRCFVKITRRLLRHGALWNEINWNKTILHDSLSVFPMLASLGTDFKSLDGRALCRAAAAGNLEAVRWLLDVGVDVNATCIVSNRPSTVLMHAIEYPSSPAVLQLLLKRGARLPADIRGSSLVPVLHCALGTYLSFCTKSRRKSSGDFHLEMIEVLLALEPDLRHPPAGGPDLLEACFIWAPDVGVETDHCLAMFDLLLKKGAPVTSPALATLIGLGGRSDLVDQLIDMVPDIHAYAVERQSRAIIVDCRVKIFGQAFSPIQAAVYRKNRERICLLLEKGADINQPAFDDRGVTALQAACQIEGNPLEHATRLSMVKFLLELGADANGRPAQKNGFSALQIAASHGDLEIALVLLHHGADPNTVDTDEWGPGRTALDFAAEQGRLDMIQLLLTVGGRSGNPGRTGVDGAIEMAREKRYFAIEKYLQAHAETTSCSSSSWVHDGVSHLDAQFGLDDIAHTFS